MAVLPSCSRAAGDAGDKARELQQVRSRIQALQERFRRGGEEKTRAERELQRLESGIGRLQQRLRTIAEELDRDGQQLAELQSRQQRQLEALQTQRRQLASEVRAAYLMGHQQQIKLLLNQQQPASVGRVLVYFAYLTRARSERIASLHETLRQLRQLEEQIEQKRARLNALQQRKRAESQRLEQQKRERQALVARLSQQLQAQGGELKRLQADERRLRELVASLQDVFADISADSGQRLPFAKLKGKLGWPVRGRLSKRFGSRRGNSGLKWEGVMIAAPEGGAVHAVAAGRVAFADWMRGFGLLLIIDHGDGYMSLYGHNESLYKEVGEWVDSGEVIATTGASGGQTKSGLYFELRHRGRPINPLRWCAGKPSARPG